MYRYLVFAYMFYYPYGGMDDCVLKTNNIDEAVNDFKYHKGRIDYVYIYDLKTEKIVMEHERP